MTVHPNLLYRDFKTGKLNRAWVSDITTNGPSYLATFVTEESSSEPSPTDLIMNATDMTVKR